MSVEVLPEKFQLQFLGAPGAQEPDIIKRARKSAWDRFLQLGLPDTRSEAFQYMRLKLLFAEKFAPPNPVEAIEGETLKTLVLPECRSSYIVFVNGFLRLDLSNTEGLHKSISIQNLGQASRSFGTLLSNRWTKRIKEEKDCFAALNFACHTDGAFLYVPPKIRVEHPIQIIHAITANTHTWFMPRLELFQGAESELTLLLSTHTSKANNNFSSFVVDAHIEDNASLSWIENGFEEERVSGWIFNAFRATLKRASRLKTILLRRGGARARYDFKIELAGQGADAHLSGLWLANQEKEVHTHVVVDHQEPHTTSMQLFKGILSDSAHSSFHGKILVRQKAQKTEAYQLNNNLLLSDTATANSKPGLEIFADDVKASHGATVGELDKEQLFYLRTRGFTEAQAKNMLIDGFAQEILGHIPIESLRELCQL